MSESIPKPHVQAARTAEIDAAALRWISEMFTDFERRVLNRYDGWPDQTVCWVWSGRPVGFYGSVALPSALGIKRNGRAPTARTHRVVWLYRRGPIPYGLTLDHDDPTVGCHNKLCGNDAHLVASSHRDNVALTGGGFIADCVRRTRCGHGHLLKPTAGDRVRACDECRQALALEQRALIKLAAETLGMVRSAYTDRYGFSGSTARKVLAEHGVDSYAIVPRPFTD